MECVLSCVWAEEIVGSFQKLDEKEIVTSTFSLPPCTLHPPHAVLHIKPELMDEYLKLA